MSAAAHCSMPSQFLSMFVTHPLRYSQEFTDALASLDWTNAVARPLDGIDQGEDEDEDEEAVEKAGGEEEEEEEEGEDGGDDGDCGVAEGVARSGLDSAGGDTSKAMQIADCCDDDNDDDIDDDAAMDQMIETLAAQCDEELLSAHHHHRNGDGSNHWNGRDDGSSSNINSNSSGHFDQTMGDHEQHSGLEVAFPCSPLAANTSKDSLSLSCRSGRSSGGDEAALLASLMPDGSDGEGSRSSVAMLLDLDCFDSGSVR